MTPSALNAFRTSLPDCDLAVYVDLSSCTVLSSDAALHYAQEYLDALCSSAATLFSAAPRAADVSTDQVLFVSPTGSRGFFRNAVAPDEALCCICAPEVDVNLLIDKANAALSGVGGTA